MEVAANEISLMVRKSLETRNWLLMKEPRKVSKLWEQVVEYMDLLDKDVTPLFNKSVAETVHLSDDRRRDRDRDRDRDDGSGMFHHDLSLFLSS